ncbi:Signal transduction histidine-protein kinase BarA [bacterium HR30]|nr:Signal transduction histidine-protein kinase BarA [bacterium HR30]
MELGRDHDRGQDQAQDAFEADAQRRIAERLPLAGIAFALVIGLAWIFEHHYFPERDRVYAIFYSLELLVIGATGWLVRTPPFRARARTLASLCTVTLVFLVIGYHVVVRSTGDVLALALLYILVGAMVAIPWGWQAQVPVAVAAIAGFLLTIGLGAQPLVPVAMHVLGLSAMGALTILGAWFLERQRWTLFQQARELQRSNQALLRANRELERANRIKNEFLASVSHELRTPLNIIMGYVDLLAEGAFGTIPKEAAEIIERLSRTSRNLVFLVGDLLDLSRIEAGRLTVELTKVDLGPVLKEAQEYVVPRLQGKPVEFTCEVPSNLAVVADRNRVQQILVNLLSNATKFTHRGSIRLFAAATGDGWVDVHVEDTGVGIPQEELAKLFEPFGQSQAGREAGGVGIGLALSKRLAMAMGGEILVQSELHKGSRFTLRLRRAN